MAQTQLRLLCNLLQSSRRCDYAVGEAMKLRFPVGTPTVFCHSRQRSRVSRLFGSWTSYQGGVLTLLEAVPGPSVKDNATRRSSSPSSCSAPRIRPGESMHTEPSDERISPISAHHSCRLLTTTKSRNRKSTFGVYILIQRSYEPSLRATLVCVITLRS